MMRSAITFLFCVCASFFLRAQSIVSPPVNPNGAWLKFDTTVYTFSQVTQGDKIIHEFRFTNIGKEAAVITEVTMSCGCQNVAYTKEPVPPGKSGVITAYFLTTGKMGTQHKVYTVKSNSTGGDVPLYLKGVVAAYSNSDSPKLKLDEVSYSFDTIISGAVVTHQFKFSNTGKTPLVINSITMGGGGFIPEYPKEPIAPGQAGVIKVTYNSIGGTGMKDKTGFINSNSVGGDSIFHMRGYVKPKPTTGPLIKFTTQYHYLNTVFEGDVAEHKFCFVNAGDAPLVISEVQQSLFVPENNLKEPIAPGDSGFVIVRYITAGKTGYFEKTTTLISNNRTGISGVTLRGNVYPKPASDAPIIKFDSTTYWFDTVYQNTIVDAHYRFTNTGKTPLIISQVTGSSGSICPSYPKEPIAPGKSAEITVIFHTGGKMGPQDKTVTITSNASEPVIVLHVRGYVILPPPFSKTPEPVPDVKPGN